MRPSIHARYLHHPWRLILVFLSFMVSAVAPANAESFLWDAVDGNDLGKAKTLITFGADVNYKNVRGYSVLDLAVSKNNPEMVELLIAKGADVNSKTEHDYTPLHGAFRKDIAEILLTHGAQVNAKTDHGQTPLDIVASGGQTMLNPTEKQLLEVAKLLIDHGASIGSALDYAAYNDDVQMATLLIAHGAPIKGKGVQPLIGAVSHGDYLKVAQLLVEKGANVNLPDIYGNHPLSAAAMVCNLKGVDFLISNGANPNTQDGAGLTAPLYFAASSDYCETTTEYLLNHGAQVDIRTFAGRTALHQAVSQRAIKIIEVLFAHNADPNARDNYDYSPLNLAIQYGQLDLAKLLIEHGANVNMGTGRDEETPLQQATCTHNIGLVKLLIAHGAEINAVSKTGMTSLLCARGQNDLTDFLLEHGAH